MDLRVRALRDEGSRKDAKTQRKPEPTVNAWLADARTGGLRGRYLNVAY
jgi:hypothetical protein